MSWKFFRPDPLGLTRDDFRALGIRAAAGPYTAFIPPNTRVRLTLHTEQPGGVSILVGIPGNGPGGYISKVLRPYGENPAEPPSIVITTPGQDFELLYEFHKGDSVLYAAGIDQGQDTATDRAASVGLLSRDMGLRIEWPADSCNVPSNVGTRAVAGTPLTQLQGDRIISDGSRWNQPIINYGFDYDRVSDIGFTRDQVSNALRQAFDAWARAPISPQFSERNHKPEVVRIGSRDTTVTAKLQIRCSWPSGTHAGTFSHQGSSSFDIGDTAHAIFPVGVVIGRHADFGGVCFNQQVRWGLNGEAGQTRFH